MIVETTPNVTPQYRLGTARKRETPATVVVGEQHSLISSVRSRHGSRRQQKCVDVVVVVAAADVVVVVVVAVVVGVVLLLFAVFFFLFIFVCSPPARSRVESRGAQKRRQ